MESRVSSTNHLAIDENLSRLFECMRLEYGTGGFLVSPKWKNFRSQKLQFAEKTRLNNAIWRCWHIQYLKGRRPLFCQFIPPLSEDKDPFQKKPLAVILEGRYWRRKLEAVAREYKKLRIYYKKWSETSPLKHLSPKAQQIDRELARQLEERARHSRRRSTSSSDGIGVASPTDVSSDAPLDQMLNIMDTSFNQDMALSSLPDTLFTSRSTNLGGSVIPQEILQQQALSLRPPGGSDAQEVFQVPTLDSLQPSLDEFMEHFESFTSMLPKQAEHINSQQGIVGQASFPSDIQSAPTTNHPSLYANQGVPFDANVPGHEEVMDHSGVYESVQPQMFAVGKVKNPQVPQEQMPDNNQVLMDISNEGSAVPDYSFGYANNIHRESFSAQLEQPALPSPLEEIQAQQLATGNSAALPPNQFVPNVDPFNAGRQLGPSNHQRKGRLPRNVSDSQLYTMDVSQIGSSFQTNLFPSLESPLPPQLQAPNLVAHLQSIPARTRAISTPTGNQAKRARLPRNMSDSRLSTLASMAKSPTSPPSLLLPSSGSQLNPIQPAVVTASSSTTHHSGRLSLARGRKSGRLPRNMSDSSLLMLDQHSSHHQVPILPSLPSGVISTRRRKMSDPQHTTVATVLAGSLQASSGVTMPVQSSALTFTNPSQELYNTTSTSAPPVASAQSQLLEQLLQSSLAAPTVNSPPSSNALSAIPTSPQTSEPFQAARSSVLGQLLTQQTAAATGSQQRESSASKSGAQEPAILKQLYQLQQVLQKQQPNMPSELVNALQSISNNSGKHQVQQNQTVTSSVQTRPVPIQPAYQVNSKNQSTAPQGLHSLLQAPPNVSIQPSPQPSQNTPVSSPTPYHMLSQVQTSPTQVNAPSVTIQHQPQTRPMPSAVNINPNAAMPTAVIISPQGGIQTTGVPIQNRPTDQGSSVPLPEMMNIGQTAVGQHILLPASVNLNTLAQLGISPATLHSVTVTLPSTAVTTSTPSSSVATVNVGVSTEPSVTISTPAIAAESQDTGGTRPVQSLSTPVKPTRPVTAQQRDQYKEHRRISHITAEQKRRGNIKMGFDQLMELVPSLANQRNSKVSKATVLQKTVDYTTKLQREKQAMQEEADMLRKQIQELNTSISMCQQQLPATGVPVARQRVDQMWAMFNQYVKTRTQDNFKFWIFSVLMRQLFEAYNNSVSTVSVEEFCQTVLTWLEQHCSLPALRPAVLSSLRDLSKATSILSDPSKVPEQALRASVSNDPTNLAAIMASGGANGGTTNTGVPGSYSGGGHT